MPDQAPDPGVPPSRRLGRYELIAQIAQGGMGTVLLARLGGVAGFQRLLAIKLLHRQYASDEEFTEMLLDEARIAARLHHPNVVSIQEVSRSDTYGYFVVMDYVEGFSLADIAGGLGPPGPVRWRLACRVLLDVLSGLEAAHTLTDDNGMPLRVVHRDLSPQNILVGIDGVSRVTDFGIAKAAARLSSTRAGQVKGKLAYMAPEQAKGEPLDARTDLFAAGVVLWEQIAARRLFKRDRDADTVNAVIAGRSPRLGTLLPGVPQSLEDFCARALEPASARRFSSAREMAMALEKVTREHDLAASPHEVGAHVRAAFERQLAERRAAVRATSASSPVPQPGWKYALVAGSLEVPHLAINAMAPAAAAALATPVLAPEATRTTRPARDPAASPTATAKPAPPRPRAPQAAPRVDVPEDETETSPHKARDVAAIAAAIAEADEPPEDETQTAPIESRAISAIAAAVAASDALIEDETKTAPNKARDLIIAATIEPSVVTDVDAVAARAAMARAPAPRPSEKRTNVSLAVPPPGDVPDEAPDDEDETALTSASSISPATLEDEDETALTRRGALPAIDTADRVPRPGRVSAPPTAARARALGSLAATMGMGRAPAEPDSDDPTALESSSAVRAIAEAVASADADEDGATAVRRGKPPAGAVPPATHMPAPGAARARVLAPVTPRAPAPAAKHAPPASPSATRVPAAAVPRAPSVDPPVSRAPAPRATRASEAALAAARVPPHAASLPETPTARRAPTAPASSAAPSDDIDDVNTDHYRVHGDPRRAPNAPSAMTTSRLTASPEEGPLVADAMDTEMERPDRDRRVLIAASVFIAVAVALAIIITASALTRPVPRQPAAPVAARVVAPPPLPMRPPPPPPPQPQPLAPPATPPSVPSPPSPLPPAASPPATEAAPRPTVRRPVVRRRPVSRPRPRRPGGAVRRRGPMQTDPPF